MIIGGDGFLGRSIANTLRKSRKSVITTSCKKQNLSDSCIYLNLTEDFSSWEAPKDVDVAFFCAAVTSIEQCRTHSAESRKVNVENTIALAYNLARKDVSIIFPSTNFVFDGQRPNRKTDDQVCPRVEYGRQKAATEAGLMDLWQNISIVRFTKILGPQTPLVKNWIDQLRNRTVIHPFSDMVLAPLPIDFASKVIIEIAEKKRFGIWQVSAREDITYEELARHIARKIGVSQRYVKPIKAHDSGLKFESIPQYTTLDTSRIENELELNPPDVWNTIDSLFGLKYGISQ